MLALAACCLAVLAVTRWRAPLGAHARTVLLLSNELPQSPGRPLEALTLPPRETRVGLDSAAGPVVADLFVPQRRLTLGPEPGARPSCWRWASPWRSRTARPCCTSRDRWPAWGTW